MTKPTSESAARLSTIQALAAKAAAGDERAFEVLHDRLSGALRRLFLERTQQRHDLADDFIQRTWTLVWQALRAGKYDPNRAAITTFVYAVGYRVWLQHLRTARRASGRNESFDAVAYELPGADAEPAGAVDDAEMIEAVRSCLSGEEADLSEEERWILRSTATGATDREIAARLKVSPSTANVRKQSAMDKVRRFLAGIGHRAEDAERTPASDE